MTKGKATPALIERNSAIVEAYLAGRSVSELADQHCLCRERIIGILNRSGLSCRFRPPEGETGKLYRKLVGALGPAAARKEMGLS